MKHLFKIVAVAGLLMTLIPPILFYLGSLDVDSMKLYMFLGALIWFSGAIPWLGKKRSSGT